MNASTQGQTTRSEPNRRYLRKLHSTPSTTPSAEIIIVSRVQVPDCLPHRLPALRESQEGLRIPARGRALVELLPQDLHDAVPLLDYPFPGAQDHHAGNEHPGSASPGIEVNFKGAANTLVSFRQLSRGKRVTYKWQKNDLEFITGCGPPSLCLPNLE